MSGLTEILSKKLHILLCCHDKKVVENKGVTQYVQQPNPLRNSFARVSHSSSALCLSKLEINFSALPDFLFRGKFMWLLCAGFLHIGGICNIICEAIHFTSRSAIQQKTVCEENIIF